MNWTWLGNLIKAIAAFFRVFRQAKVEEQQAAQQAQDDLVAETEEKIDAVPDKTDDELYDIAESTGLVQPKGSSRPE